MPDFGYSLRKYFTGFDVATLMVCDQTINNPNPAMRAILIPINSGVI